MTSLTLLLPQMMTMRVPQTCLLGWTKSGGYGTCLLVVTSASLSSHLSLQQSGLWLSHTTNQLQTQLNAHPYCSRTHYHCIPKISLHPTNWNWTKKKKKILVIRCTKGQEVKVLPDIKIPMLVIICV